jgi:hypothetical protein
MEEDNKNANQDEDKHEDRETMHETDDQEEEEHDTETTRKKVLFPSNALWTPYCSFQMR